MFRRFIFVRRILSFLGSLFFHLPRLFCQTFTYVRGLMFGSFTGIFVFRFKLFNALFDNNILVEKANPALAFIFNWRVSAISILHFHPIISICTRHWTNLYWYPVPYQNYHFETRNVFLVPLTFLLCLIKVSAALIYCIRNPWGVSDCIY